MNNKLFAISVACLAILSCNGSKIKRSYEELPLGAIRPQGWLEEMLLRQRDGITADLDKTYEKVLGDANGWLGGPGDRW